MTDERSLYVWGLNITLLLAAEFGYLIIGGGCVSVLLEHTQRPGDGVSRVNVNRCSVSYVLLVTLDDRTVHPAAQTHHKIGFIKSTCG